MRLIDADALMKEIDKELFSTESRKCYEKMRVRKQPTIDAEPVRHGHNVTPTHHSDMFMCSECGFTCEIIELRYDDDGMGEPNAYEYDCNYCPNCGAKMDLEVRDDNTRSNPPA